MPITRVSTLPEGVRERTFALKSHPGGETVRFGRHSDFPASSYVFPSIEADTESYRGIGSHSTSYGNTSLTPDYFEAQVGALEPDSAGKLDRLARAWNMPNFKRVSGERHELYYVLGGRARMMYGKPGRIGFIHHGYKTSYHESLLRFNVSDPFFYSADEIVASGATTSVGAGTTQTSTVSLDGFADTEIPTPARIRVEGTAKKVTVAADGNPLLILRDLSGEFWLDNYPGFSRTAFQAAGSSDPLTTGADLIGVDTPPFRSCNIVPGQENITFTVEAPDDASANVEYEVVWRDAYGSP